MRIKIADMSFFWTCVVLIAMAIGYVLYRGLLRTPFSRIQQKIFARVMSSFEIVHNKAVTKHKPVLFCKLHEMSEKIKLQTLSILEIGAGTGANFKFFPDGCNVTCVNPNSYFESYLETKQEQFPHLNIKDLIVGKAEDLSMIPNDTFDVVVCTLVLCSVNDVGQSLKEMKRVLKHGGALLYMEHVRADEKSWTHTFQWLLNYSIWSIISDGCSLIKKTSENVKSAGFSNVSQQEIWVQMQFPLCVMSTHIMGVATK